MEIVATAMKEFAKNQNLEADISLEDKIIKSKIGRASCRERV